MNYLAHVLLAPREVHAILGALMGDFRKHVNWCELPVPIVQGMEHHRAVDKFTDSHPQVSSMKKLFSRARRRYAGIILDITFDHFLSRHWQAFTAEDRTEFIDFVYGCLRQSPAILPLRMHHAMHYMMQEDWLGSYAELDGVASSLNRLSQRMRFQNQLYGSIEEVRANYTALEQGFLEFFPQLIDHVTPGRSAMLVAKPAAMPPCIQK